MRKSTIMRAVASASFLVLSWVAYTQTQPAKLTITKVKEDLYNIEGDGGNVAALVTSEGVILIDDKYERDHDQIVAGGLQQRQGLGHTWEQADLLLAPQQAHVFHQHAVPVQKHGGAQQRQSF